jgi:hypothetical protein
LIEISVAPSGIESEIIAITNTNNPNFVLEMKEKGIIAI